MCGPISTVIVAGITGIGATIAACSLNSGIVTAVSSGSGSETTQCQNFEQLII